MVNLKNMSTEYLQAKADTLKQQATTEFDCSLEGTLQYDCAKLKLEISELYFAIVEALPFRDKSEVADIEDEWDFADWPGDDDDSQDGGEAGDDEMEDDYDYSYIADEDSDSEGGDSDDGKT